jgi:RND family efflux transporter MFP subunit
MKRILKWSVIGFAALAALSFIVCNVYKSSRPPVAAEPPDLDESPARVYGRVEPAGGPVYVSPDVTRSVQEILVEEGDAVSKGQLLCVLEDGVESAQLRVAESRAASMQKSLELSRDTLERNRALYEGGRISEYEYTQARLQAELEGKNLNVAYGELALARARLDQLRLTSPIDGVVYKCDVRLGETLAAGDNSRIVLGPRELWVRLYVEAFWVDRVREGAKYKIYDAETDEYLGDGTVVRRNPYVGARDFESEDLQERFDTKFQEVILSFANKKKDIPLGLNVMAELAEKK